MKCTNCNLEYESNFCPNCGTPAHYETKIDKGSYYCTNCGEVTKLRVCAHCGVKNNKVHNYCYWCGEKLHAYATACPKCKEKTVCGVPGIIWIIISVLWMAFCSLMIVGSLLTSNILSGIVFATAAAVLLPVWDKLVRKVTFSKERKSIIRMGVNALRLTLAFVIFIAACFIPTEITPGSEEAKLSSYTYDEYVMYSTITKGYGKTLDALKNPKTADFLGIGYNPNSEMVYFCVIAENDFGANTKCYISYSKKYDMLDESDDLKYYYDTAEIKRTMDDLNAFMEAVKNADESDVPTRGRNEALESYSKAEREIYDLMIAGLENLGISYDDLLIMGYRYSSDSKSALFYFTGEDAGGEMVMTYAKYSDGLGLMVSDAYKSMYDNADTEVLAPQIVEYKEALKKDITK